MRLCFDTFCFTSRLNAADEESTTGDLAVAGSPNAVLVQSQLASASEMGPPQEIQRLLQSKEDQIRELMEKLRLRDEEICQLRSHLDKFQSVFPFYVASPKHKGLNNNVGPRPRKQRAQGISAEPQSEASIQELSRQTFQTYDKNER